MGCSASVDTPRVDQNKVPVVKSSKTASNHHTVVDPLPPIKRERPNAVAFDINVGEKDVKGVLDPNHDIEALLAKPLPKRLQRLAPLGVPMLTERQLSEKLTKAERKRKESISEKLTFNRKISRRRSEFLEAKQASESQNLDDSMNCQTSRLQAADKAREARLATIREKQKIQAERAQRARERARKLKENVEENFDMETDVKEKTCIESDDSWSDGETFQKGESKAPYRKSDNDMDDHAEDAFFADINDYHLKPKRIDSGKSGISSGYNSRDISANAHTRSTGLSGDFNQEFPPEMPNNFAREPLPPLNLH